jgi:ribosomal-protein-serine acetyltransferase
MFEIEVNNEVKLREIQMSDAPDIFSIIDCDRLYLRKWLPFVDYTKIVDDTENFIKNVHAAPADIKELTYVILYNNKVVGLVGLRSTDRANHKSEIGYWLAENMQGKGLVTLSCQKLIELCFNVLKMNRMQIKVATENYRSKKIPFRLGFRFEGIEREGEFLNGKHVDIEVYSLLKKEWMQKDNQ